MHIKDQVERVEKQKKNKIRTIWKGEEKIINYLFYFMLLQHKYEKDDSLMGCAILE